MKALARIVLFFFLFFCVLGFSPMEAKDNTFVLVIDPGHGGRDSGALGKKGKEKDINLKVAKYTGEYIRQNHPDVKVIFTRSIDKFIGLHERADIANKNKAHLFISIHTNSVKNTSVRGPEVFTLGTAKTKENLEVAKKENSVIYMEDDYEEKYRNFNMDSPESIMMLEFMQSVYAEQSLDFAGIVQKELKACTTWPDRGVKQAAYLVLWKATMPRVLIELDFISNREAENYLMTEKGQKKYAKSISDAFSKYKKGYDRRTEAVTQNSSKDTSETVPSPVSDAKLGNKIYKVQILSSTRKLPFNSRELKGYTASYYKENNLFKYTYGESQDWSEISKIRKSLLKDFKDAFIICFENGVKVPINKKK